MAVNLNEKKNNEIKSEGIIELYLGGTTLNEQIQIGTCPDDTDMRDTGFKFRSVNSETSIASYVYNINSVNEDNPSLCSAMKTIHQYDFLEKINKIDKLELTEQGKKEIKKLIRNLKKYYNTRLENEKFAYTDQYVAHIETLNKLYDKFKLDKSDFFDKELHGKIEEDKLDEMMKKSIAAQIIKDAMINWGDANDNDEAEEIINKAEDFEELRKNKTQGSDLNAIDGMCKICGLTEKESEELKYQISTSDKISKRLAKKIKNKMQENPYGIEGNILEILSYVHYMWCSNEKNGKKFTDAERVNKQFQFSSFLYLNWKEAASNFLFLKPILEGCGITCSEKKLERVFYAKQREISKKLINTNEKIPHTYLKSRIAEGINFNPALKGVKGHDDQLITDLLQLEDTQENLACQIANNLEISLDEEKRKEIIKAEIEELFTVKTQSAEGKKVEDDTDIKIDDTSLDNIVKAIIDLEDKGIIVNDEIIGDLIYKMYYSKENKIKQQYIEHIKKIQQKRGIVRE